MEEAASEEPEGDEEEELREQRLFLLFLSLWRRSGHALPAPSSSLPYPLVYDQRDGSLRCSRRQGAGRLHPLRVMTGRGVWAVGRPLFFVVTPGSAGGPKFPVTA